uniref:Apple domain-containing protein n=1 Tax=Caenorhabditis tropicalis TaxID=1561998 RepID=A0A1I7T3H6_9PELO
MIATTVFGLMMMHVGAASVQSCLFLPNVSLNGGTVDEFQTEDITQCCVQCSTSGCCIAYTYDTIKKRCYLKNAIGYSTEDFTMTSGLKPNSRFGVTLKNVKILGDQTNRIELRSEEECRQYCSAYQVFSWGPPRGDHHSKTAECACTMRIKSLSYDFGCTSEINPSQG